MNDEPLLEQLEQIRRSQPAAPPYLAARIVATLPETSALERLTLWLLASVPRTAVLAAVPLLAGFVFGFNAQPRDDQALAVWLTSEDLVYTATQLEEYEYDEI